ncbi:prepilin peptidase [Candidatus Saccharibacteria bacterium]|nr:prepilin peptidase [Candidatus Saccharibacteria bacterium]
MEYLRIIVIVFSAIFGAAFGSFACCQAWRIRLKEEGKKDPGRRSVCLNCGKRLTWYENIPIISWILQGGKCRKCGKKIGKAEILAEVFGAVSFGLIAWRFLSAGTINYIGFSLVLLMIVGMLLLAIYDAKWQEMPVVVLVYVIIMGLALAVLGIVQTGVSMNGILSLLGSVALLAGTYYLLYLFSKERLVGEGDWMLCLAIGLALGKWQLALVELFLANFIGSIVMVGLGKKKAAFGPFLVIAFVAIVVLEDVIMHYLSF